MLCLPAFTPVANDAHAVGDSGECVVCSDEKPPCFARALMLGSLPSAIHFSSRWGSMPSKPRMTSFWLNFEDPRRGDEEHAGDRTVTAATATKTSRIDLHMRIERIITPAMEPILRDIRLALRRLRNAPGFTLFAIASLALGIGVSTGIYSAVRTLLWMPLGLPDPGQLIVVAADGRSYPAMSWPDFQDLRSAQTSGRALAAGGAIQKTSWPGG